MRGDRLLEDALDALRRALDATGAPWMIIGGIAVIARGVRRFTTDIDAAVRGDAAPIERLGKALAREGIVARIPDAIPFARANLVLLARHGATGVDLDVSFAWSSFEHEAIDSATKAAFGRVRAPMSTPADLVVFKAIAGRPQDRSDAEALLVLYPKIDPRRVRARVAELAALAAAPELLADFDALLARARPPLQRTKRSTPPKKRRR